MGKKGVCVEKKTLVFMFGLMIMLFVALPASADSVSDLPRNQISPPEERVPRIEAAAQKQVSRGDKTDSILHALAEASMSPEEKAARIEAEAQKQVARTMTIAIIAGVGIIAIAIIAVNRNKKDLTSSKLIDMVAEGDLFCSKCGKKLSVDDAFCSGCGTKIESLNT